MYWGLFFFLFPVIFFIILFLIETVLSIKRLFGHSAKKYYIETTWEVTHTLLIIGLIMLFVFFSSSLSELAKYIYIYAFLAGLFLLIRGTLYSYVFYVKKGKKNNIADYLFSLMHILAAIFLIITVFRAVKFVLVNHPAANTQFIPYYVPGLLITLGIISLPLFYIYRIKD